MASDEGAGGLHGLQGSSTISLSKLLLGVICSLRLFGTGCSEDSDGYLIPSCVALPSSSSSLQSSSIDGAYTSKDDESNTVARGDEAVLSVLGFCNWIKNSRVEESDNGELGGSLGFLMGLNASQNGGTPASSSTLLGCTVFARRRVGRCH